MSITPVMDMVALAAHASVLNFKACQNYSLHINWQVWRVNPRTLMALYYVMLSTSLSESRQKLCHLKAKSCKWHPAPLTNEKEFCEKRLPSCSTLLNNGVALIQFLLRSSKSTINLRLALALKFPSKVIASKWQEVDSSQVHPLENILIITGLNLKRTSFI